MLGFHCSLNKSKCLQVSRTLLSILSYLISLVLCMVPILPLISSSPISFPESWGPFQRLQLHRHIHVPQIFPFSGEVPICTVFHLPSFSLCHLLNQQNPLNVRLFLFCFLLINTVLSSSPDLRNSQWITFRPRFCILFEIVCCIQLDLRLDREGKAYDSQLCSNKLGYLEEIWGSEKACYH